MPVHSGSSDPYVWVALLQYDSTRTVATARPVTVEDKIGIRPLQVYGLGKDSQGQVEERPDTSQGKPLELDAAGGVTVYDVAPGAFFKVLAKSASSEADTDGSDSWPKVGATAIGTACGCTKQDTPAARRPGLFLSIGRTALTTPASRQGLRRCNAVGKSSSTGSTRAGASKAFRWPEN